MNVNAFKSLITKAALTALVLIGTLFVLVGMYVAAILVGIFRILAPQEK